MSIWIETAVLALVQGIAEFLPISSSGHLVLIGGLLGMSGEENLSLGIVLHAGSLLAVICFYFRLLIGFFRKDQLHLLLMVLVGVLPCGLVGVLLSVSGWGEKLFSNPLLIAMAMLVTGMLLRLTGKEKLLPEKTVEDVKNITFRQALTVGVVQIAAILPGISRSGSTIAAGLFSGIGKEAAASFSFLLAMPLMAGACLLEIIKLLKAFQLEQSAFMPLPLLIFAVVLSFAVSLASLVFLVKLLKKGRLACFSWYLFAVGTGALIWYGVLQYKGAI